MHRPKRSVHRPQTTRERKGERLILLHTFIIILMDYSELIQLPITMRRTHIYAHTKTKEKILPNVDFSILTSNDDGKEISKYILSLFWCDLKISSLPFSTSFFFLVYIFSQFLFISCVEDFLVFYRNHIQSIIMRKS